MTGYTVEQNDGDFRLCSETVLEARSNSALVGCVISDKIQLSPRPIGVLFTEKQ